MFSSCTARLSLTYLLLVWMLLVTPSLALEKGKPVNRVIDHQGTQRDYILYVPSGYRADSPSPLVLNFHGMNGSAQQMMHTTKMNAVAEKGNFVVAYPNAKGHWATGPDPNKAFMDNVRFVDAIIESIKGDCQVDSSRVFATGLSQGGVMSYVLGVTRANTFAAIASVSGTRPGQDSTRLFPFSVSTVPARPVPLLHLHGTDDDLVPHEGGLVSLPGVDQKVPFPPVMDVVRGWAKNNGSTTIGEEKVLEDICSIDGVGNDSSTVSLFRFRDCKHYTGKSGKNIVAEVLYFRVNGGGHAWPVLEPDRKESIAALTKTLGKEMVASGGAINSDISASAEIWKFFRRHELPSTKKR